MSPVPSRGKWSLTGQTEEEFSNKKRLWSRESHQPGTCCFLISNAVQKVTHSKNCIFSPYPGVSSARCWLSPGAIVTLRPQPKSCLHLRAYLGSAWERPGLNHSPFFFLLAGYKCPTDRWWALLWKKEGSATSVWRWDWAQVSCSPEKWSDHESCATGTQLSHLNETCLFFCFSGFFIQLLLAGLCGLKVNSVRHILSPPRDEATGDIKN